VRVEAPAGGQREVAVDGEVLGSLPARFTVQPASLRVVVPAVAE
jgi:diacylglycerol kinase family enzyme